MKKRKKLNTVDVIIAAVFILFLLVFARHISKNSFSELSANGSPVMLDVTVVTDSINESYAGNIKVNEPVNDTENGRIFGRIETLEISNVYGTSEHFTEEKPMPESKILNIVIRCEAMKYENYYVIGDKKVVIGEKLNLMSPGLCFKAECISANEAAASNIFRGQQGKKPALPVR